MRDAPELSKQFLNGTLPHPGYFQQSAPHLAFSPSQAMKGHRKPVRLVANLLNQVEDRRMRFEGDWLVLLAMNVNDLFLFGDAGERLIDDLQFFKRLCGGVELPNAAVNQDQARELLLFFLQSPVAALDGF